MATMDGISRRNFLKTASAAAAAGPLATGLGVNAAQERKPNVIVIMTDDQGYGDAGCYGADDVETPALDGLAERGVRFTQFYTGGPICSPSRACMLTGRYPIRAGMPGNTSSQPGAPGMSNEMTTLADMFKAAGYATGHVGKWHLGYSEDTMPNAQGFDFSFGHMGGCIDNYSHFFYWSGPNQHDLWRNGERERRYGEFFPDLMVEEAKGFMEAHQDEPFFLFYPMNTPHYPYQGTPEWLERYEEKGVPYPRDLYGAFLSTQDERMGQLLDAVDELGLTEDTIVVFQPDHGHSVESRAHHGGGSAGPYRSAKFSLFEGGIRVPVVISWPGHLPEGEARGQVLHGADWLPTLAELTGVPILDDDIDGHSIVPVLEDSEAPTPHEVLHWVGSRNQWAVRRGPWKLIGNVWDPTETGDDLTEDDRELFLANFEEDPSEMTNFASQNPEVVNELRELHEEFEASLE